jgi:hypothetical protein
MQLRLDLFEDQMVAVENLRDVRTELAGVGIDDLIFLFDSQRE